VNHFQVSFFREFDTPKNPAMISILLRGRLFTLDLRDSNSPNRCPEDQVDTQPSLIVA